jgi:hypothetical protein
MSNSNKDPSTLAGIDERYCESLVNGEWSRDPYLAALSRKPLDLNIAGISVLISHRTNSLQEVGHTSEGPSNFEPAVVQNRSRTPANLNFERAEHRGHELGKNQDLDKDRFVKHVLNVGWSNGTDTVRLC